jgi:hypothetical protein
MPYSFNPLSGLGLDQSIPLDGAGKIPSDYLPSYVDDVVEYANLAGFPATGETGKIYVAIDTGFTYRWSGSVYIQINSLTGTFAADAGTAAAPSISIGTADNGLYAPAEDQVAISTNGTGRLFVDASGRVGIGSTTGFVERFHVNGNIRTDANDTGLFFNSSTTAITGNGTSSYIAFNTSNAEKARIDSSGRLLVGTSSARSNIDGGNTPQTQFEGVGYPGATISLTRNSADSGAPSFYFAKTRSASVGGIAAAQAGDTVGQIIWTASDGTNTIKAAAIDAYVDGTPGANDMPGRIVLSTTADGASSPTERMRITANGVFKQSTSGSYNDATGIYNEFNVDNSNSYVVITRCTSSSPASEYIQDFRFSAAAPNNTSARFWSCTDNSAVRGYLASNGGLYNYSANNSNLSDRNAKKDISLAAGTWDCLKEWEIVNFRYKDQPDDAGLNLGVIAQQVAESCPEVITVFQEAKEATDTEPAQEERIGVKEQQMMWMAIKALQEAQLRIETLEAEVAALKAS